MTELCSDAANCIRTRNGRISGASASSRTVEVSPCYRKRGRYLRKRNTASPSGIAILALVCKTATARSANRGDEFVLCKKYAATSDERRNKTSHEYTRSDSVFLSTLRSRASLLSARRTKLPLVLAIQNRPCRSAGQTHQHCHA